MGYTHYWKLDAKAVPEDAWAKLIEDVKLILADQKLGALAAGWDGTGKPDVGPEGISLNGVSPDNYETFTLSRDESAGFCKTAGIVSGLRKYDVIVTLILLRAKQRLGDAIKVKSDGRWEEWKPARDEHKRLFKKVASKPVEMR